MAKRYSIYASAALDRALAARVHGDPDAETGFRSRSSMISAIADRYAEICRREMPVLALGEWLAVFGALNGCWMLDNAAMAAQGIALEVADADRLNGLGITWGIDGQALAARLGGMSFAAKVAVLDAAERWWALDVQPGTADPNASAIEHWRAPVRALVGALAD